jgi:hypothetical protein
MPLGRERNYLEKINFINGVNFLMRLVAFVKGKTPGNTKCLKV